MSRTKAWQKKMDELTEKEKSLRSELEFRSGKLEKRGLVALGVAGLVTVVIISVFAFRSKKTKVELKPQPVNNTPPVKTKADRRRNLSAMITEKVVAAIITVLISKFQKDALSDEEVKS
ncbi:MAG: hypothetical protein RH948_19305 [Cyclobacteriaceae bacterium]